MTEYSLEELVETRDFIRRVMAWCGTLSICVIAFAVGWGFSYAMWDWSPTQYPSRMAWWLFWMFLLSLGGGVVMYWIAEDIQEEIDDND